MLSRPPGAEKSLPQGADYVSPKGEIIKPKDDFYQDGFYHCGHFVMKIVGSLERNDFNCFRISTRASSKRKTSTDIVQVDPTTAPTHSSATVKPTQPPTSTKVDKESFNNPKPLPMRPFGSSTTRSEAAAPAPVVLRSALELWTEQT